MSFFILSRTLCSFRGPMQGTLHVTFLDLYEQVQFFECGHLASQLKGLYP
jgi:hypothetical protein